MFAWKMTRPVNLFALYSGLPLVGLGSFAVQTSIGSRQFRRDRSQTPRFLGVKDTFRRPSVLH